jgi:hypothetical protein
LKKIVLVFLAVVLALSLFACTSSNSNPSVDNQESPTLNDNQDETKPHEDETSPSIAGICLDDTSEQVDNVLGSDYTETYMDIAGHFGESYYVREYNDGLSVIIGKDSDKVLEIELVSDKYQTWLGDKIGDTANDILSKYRKLYTEPETIHSDGKLEGWFDVGDGMVLIFDFNKDDNMIINVDISLDSKVELIKLTKMMYLD